MFLSGLRDLLGPEATMIRFHHLSVVFFSISIMFTPAAHSQSLKAEDAHVKDKFVEKSIEAPSEGWLVAHKGGGGQPGKIVGSVMIKPGSNTEVRIPVTGTLDHGPNAVIILMMHEDAGTKGTFDASEDKPTMQDSKPVMAEVIIE
jgi:hypothetical protein